MSSQNQRPGIERRPLTVIRMASALFMMLFKEALIGWRIFFVEKEKRVGSWFNLDIIIGNSFVYGKRKKKPGRSAEDIYSVSN
jgi:hypothetical protein